MRIRRLPPRPAGLAVRGRPRKRPIARFSRACLLLIVMPFSRHTRTCSGYLPPPFPPDGRMDARNKSGHDGGNVGRRTLTAKQEAG